MNVMDELRILRGFESRLVARLTQYPSRSDETQRMLRLVREKIAAAYPEEG